MRYATVIQLSYYINIVIDLPDDPILIDYRQS